MNERTNRFIAGLLEHLERFETLTPDGKVLLSIVCKPPLEKIDLWTTVVEGSVLITIAPNKGPQHHFWAEAEKLDHKDTIERTLNFFVRVHEFSKSCI